MKLRLFLSGILLLSMVALLAPLSQAKPRPRPKVEGVIPSANFLVKPFALIKNFPTGTNKIVQAQYNDLLKTLQFLQANKDMIAILAGTVSNLKIRGSCYVSKDYSYFSLRQPREDTTRLTGNDACQMALALSRAIATRNWLIKGLGDGQTMKGKRVLVLRFPAQTMNPGGNFPNQSVVVWMVTTKDSENPDVTSLTVPCPDCNCDCPDCKQPPPPPPEPPPVPKKKKGEVKIYKYKVDR